MYRGNTRPQRGGYPPAASHDFYPRNMYGANGYPPNYRSKPEQPHPPRRHSSPIRRAGGEDYRDWPPHRDYTHVCSLLHSLRSRFPTPYSIDFIIHITMIEFN